eukprot:6689175-Pyramimonas_sp.AAC.1
MFTGILRWDIGSLRAYRTVFTPKKGRSLLGVGEHEGGGNPSPGPRWHPKGEGNSFALCKRAFGMRPGRYNIPSFYGSSCANNGKDALNTPRIRYVTWQVCSPRRPIVCDLAGIFSPSANRAYVFAFLEALLEEVVRGGVEAESAVRDEPLRIT